MVTTTPDIFKTRQHPNLMAYLVEEFVVGDYTPLCAGRPVMG
jgi:hypothetical protein